MVIDFGKNPVGDRAVGTLLRHRTGGGFINTIRLVSKITGKTRPYKTINCTIRAPKAKIRLTVWARQSKSLAFNKYPKRCAIASKS
ncbi:MAG TPA: hypothetical protein DDW76_01260 [Cyanobacteria bacterium UBA11369]|nr:hypothetical protein [Cyanobacteria bacterium UBA11371]HBE35075.1 hypothetical protein [Cyanobacteria bacterium UBA11368]HBE47461.1 hypothetical protein [Cyanobacteria bacterium UBA11369]